MDPRRARKCLTKIESETPRAEYETAPAAYAAYGGSGSDGKHWWLGTHVRWFLLQLWSTIGEDRTRFLLSAVSPP
jgi:hypothetical protein